MLSTVIQVVNNLLYILIYKYGIQVIQVLSIWYFNCFVTTFNENKDNHDNSSQY